MAATSVPLRAYDAPRAERGSLPRGVHVQAAGARLDHVESRAGSLDLIASGCGVELVRGHLRDGERMNFVPGSGPATFEVAVVLCGALAHVAGHGPVVGPGGSVTCDGLEAPISFEAVGDVEFLYVSSAPTFQDISDDLRQLRELAVSVELKDGYTADHCDRLQRLSHATGRLIGLDAAALYRLDFGAYLHDVGKVRVPLSILSKPGALDASEWEEIRRHPGYGRAMLDGTFMAAAGPIVEQHHERLDGSGYPFGLGRAEIAVEAQIVAVADTYDAMTTDRPYRAALPPAEAFAELDRLAGVHYDAEVVRAFRCAVGAVEPTAAATT